MGTLGTTTLGANGPTVGRVGLGRMGMSDFYGPADQDESLATVRAALDAGVVMLDTGDFYGMGRNQSLVREAIAGRRREEVVVAVKFGARRDPANAFVGFDARPAAVKTALAYTPRRLGTDCVDVRMPARLDAGRGRRRAVADLVRAGYVRQVGLSEVAAPTRPTRSPRCRSSTR